jgi:hypothetical protein
MTERGVLQQVHALLQAALYDAFPEDVENYLRDAYELIDAHLNAAGFRSVHDSEVEAMVEDEADRRVA